MGRAGFVVQGRFKNNSSKAGLVLRMGCVCACVQGFEQTKRR